MLNQNHVEPQKLCGPFPLLFQSWPCCFEPFLFIGTLDVFHEMLTQEIKHVVSQASLLAMIIGVPVIENQFGVRIPNRTVDSHLSKDEKMYCQSDIRR